MQVVVALGAGAAGTQGAVDGIIAAGLSPLAVAGFQRIDRVIRSRRESHASQTLLDAADEAGVASDEEFIDFIERLLVDDEHQELLARVLTAARDASLRDKRLALGRALAASIDEASDVDTELLFVRALEDLDAPHVRMLRLLSTTPAHLKAAGQHGVRQWFPWSIATADPGLSGTCEGLLMVLERHGLAWSTSQAFPTPVQTMEVQYEISPYGEWVLERLGCESAC